MEKKRILIIDDEPKFTRLLRMNLEQEGSYEVREENWGKRALSTAQEFDPDLILMDVIMPDIDGASVAEQFKGNERLRNVPVIFLTAVVSKQEVGTAAKNIGGNMFIAKPVSIKELVDSIQKTIQGN